MRRILLLLHIFVLVIPAVGQPKAARKVDEFGNATCEDIKARLDKLAIALINEPLARGFVIVYEGKHAHNVYDKNGDYEIKYYLPAKGESGYLSGLMKVYLTKTRGMSPEKVLFISGGYQENYKVELWLVPLGSDPPETNSTIKKIKYRKGKPRSLDCSH